MISQRYLSVPVFECQYPILPISSSKSSFLPSLLKIRFRRLLRIFETYEGVHFFSLEISIGIR